MPVPQIFLTLYVPVRVLLVGGSEHSYMTTRLKERLEMKPIKREMLNLNTSGEVPKERL